MVERVIKEVSFHYLDEVELNIEPHIQVNHTREIQKKTFLGKVKGGTLTVNIDIRADQGADAVRDRRRVVFAGGNRAQPRRARSGGQRRGNGRLLLQVGLGRASPT